MLLQSDSGIAVLHLLGSLAGNLSQTTYMVELELSFFNLFWFCCVGFLAGSYIYSRQVKVQPPASASSARILDLDHQAHLRFLVPEENTFPNI